MTHQSQKSATWFAHHYKKASRHSLYSICLFILGLPLHLLVLFMYIKRKRSIQADDINYDDQRGDEDLGRLRKQELAKQTFFNEQKTGKETEQIVQQRFRQLKVEAQEKEAHQTGKVRLTFKQEIASFLSKPKGLFIGIVLGFPMFLLLTVYAYPYVKYIFDRFIMMLFVIAGVTTVVFSILHFSSFNPAVNILGAQASAEQIENFNRVYGLDQPYLVQLWKTFQGILTFDLGLSFEGREDVASTILRKFPITLQLTLLSLALAIIVAIPAGIYAAVKRNSIYDQSLMFVALIGLSIPSFWLGLVMIMQFSIHLGWLPSTYRASNSLSLIMPTIVLGTGLMAAVARMARSSTLEVIGEDYILMARAKGLSSRHVLVKHAVPNALIPIVTVIGLQFGGLLGGAAVTEKVFNISGLGSYIVDKQFVPDIPSVLGGVIYIAIAISIVNVVIDILYTFLDPRIRSKMKEY
ncbi:ABC transporter permease [Alkalicoccobacillus murimartini]|uniref:Peptide/nickel transport system permease protein n=1 Tax=Alkalicoccobacillus murimartini TaxID=171685 RepID=A0ABT9YHF9_9BACI|nr:ABC transporter permease [Alkalicoccobacillus murimartini]MDQ0207295.1 peptide/nickel transport system permease protein [Alkalicoccobacillus murimartini]